jgi:hypothetical protein
MKWKGALVAEVLYPGIFVEGLKKIIENPSPNNRSLG